MPLKNYSLLKGNVSDVALDDDESPHIELRIEENGNSHRIAVNVRSQIAPHDLLYLRFRNYDFPDLTNILSSVKTGRHDIRASGLEITLDYVHGGLFSKSDFQIAPYMQPGENNDLRDFIFPIAEAAKGVSSIFTYAFGEAWGPEATRPDKYFGFVPGNGIHDIHMNQGSQGRFTDSNGPRQDGALFFHDTATGEWTAIYLAFQSQSWNTDPATGNAIGITQPIPVNPNPQNPSVMIIAALVNAVGKEEGKETITIINRSDKDIDLTGWYVADHESRKQNLTGILSAGITSMIQLEDNNNAPRLSNKGGDISVMAPDDSVAHSVSYRKSDVTQEGWTLVFQ